MIKLEPEGPHGFQYAAFIDNQHNSPTPEPSSSDEEETFEVDEDEIFDYMKPSTSQLESDASISLTEEEEKIVASCTDPELKELILLNRKKNAQLLATFNMFNNMLEECQMAIFEQSQVSKEVKKKKTKSSTRRKTPKLWRLGFPYFKSVDDYPCPRNADMVKKEARGELYFYGIKSSPKWVCEDGDKLLEGVAYWYKENKITELQRQIKKLKEKQIKSEKENIKLQELEGELADLESSDKAIYPKLGDEKRVDWSTITMRVLEDRYSGDDCKCLWKNYLHPKINKEEWTPKENERLKSLASANNYQNWDLIAKKLGGNRSSFLTCAYFYSEIKPHRIQGPFSAEEDELLLHLINKYKHGNTILWEKIVHYFPKRLRTQIYYRYTYFLKENYRIKDKFTEAEDILLMILVDRFGRKYTQITEYFPQRSANQLKARYISQLNEAKKRGAFTLNEDKEILRLVEENGSNKWSYMEKRFQRTSATIRQRYLTLKAFMEMNPGKKLPEAPRRSFFKDSNLAQYSILRLIADKFKIYKKIPTIEEIEELMGKKNSDPSTSQTMDPPKPIKVEDLASSMSRNTKHVQVYTQRKKEEIGFSATCFPTLTMDALLRDYFKSSIQIEESDELIELAANNVQTILDTLQAELYIPTTFRSEPRLDSIDVEILGKITEKLTIVNDQYVIKRNVIPHIRYFIPPNSNTLTGLQQMLTKIKVNHMNSDEWPDNDDFNQVKWCMLKYMSNQSPEVKKKLKFERNLFTERFISLFKYPAVLSKIPPNKSLLSFFQRPAVKTYQRKIKSEVSPNVNNSNRTPSTSRLPVLEPAPSTIPFESVFIEEENIEKVKVIELKPELDDSEDPLEKLTIIEELQQKIFKTIEDFSKKSVTKFTETQPALVTNTCGKNEAKSYSSSTLATIKGEPPAKKVKTECEI